MQQLESKINNLAKGTSGEAKLAGNLKQLASELKGLELDHSSTKKTLNDFTDIVATLSEAPSAKDVKMINSRVDNIENSVTRVSKIVNEHEKKFTRNQSKFDKLDALDQKLELLEGLSEEIRQVRLDMENS